MRSPVRPDIAWRSVALGVCLVLATTACGAVGDASGDGAAPSGGPDPLVVVATTSILGDLVATLVGDDAEVDVVIPAGADPHTFSPSAQQAQLLRRADLVVANGLGLEATLSDVLAAARDDGVRIFEVGPALDPLALMPDGVADPHVWFDPLRMATGVILVAEQLAQADDRDGGVGAVQWERRGAALADDLIRLDTEVGAILAGVPVSRRQLVTNHDSLGYLADRYGFEVIGTVIPGTSTQVQPNARDVAALGALIRSSGVPAIFVDAESAADVARAMAGEVNGVMVVVLRTGSLGAPGSGAASYSELLLTTARLIADALA